MRSLAVSSCISLFVPLFPFCAWTFSGQGFAETIEHGDTIEVLDGDVGAQDIPSPLALDAGRYQVCVFVTIKHETKTTKNTSYGRSTRGRDPNRAPLVAQPIFNVDKYNTVHTNGNRDCAASTCSANNSIFYPGFPEIRGPQSDQFGHSWNPFALSTTGCPARYSCVHSRVKVKYAGVFYSRQGLSSKHFPQLWFNSRRFLLPSKTRMTERQLPRPRAKISATDLSVPIMAAVCLTRRM